MNKEEPKCTVDWAATQRWKLNNGKLHRVDGPAVEYENGIKAYYINGEEIACTLIPLTVGQSINWWNNSLALIIKQINPILFQILAGNQKLYLFRRVDHYYYE